MRGGNLFGGVLFSPDPAYLHKYLSAHPVQFFVVYRLATLMMKVF
jgi:hypothetical protein